MKKFTFYTALYLISFSLFPQTAAKFPDLEGESLSRKMINIPFDVAGKYTLIGLAFSKKSEEDLNSWFQPAYNQFIHKPDKPSLFMVNYDINVYFIPMFTGVKRPAYEKVMEKVAKDIDPRLFPHVLFYKGSIKAYKESLNFDGKDIPYFYVLDPAGNIVFTTSGRYSDGKMQKIVNLLDNAAME